MFDAQHMLLIVALAVLGHVLLFALHRQVHPVMLLLMVFVIASMLSAATMLPGLVGIKWARLYVTLLALAIAVVCVRPSQLGAASWSMLGFGACYVAAALWSDDPVGGLLFKGMFLVTLMVGVAAVLVAREYGGLWTLMRCLVLAGAGVVSVLLIGLAANPGMVAGGERLALFGLNPNRIAETLAPLILVGVFGLLHDPSRPWRLACYVMVVPAGALLLATGSRTGFILAMIGFVVLMLPVVRRPALFAAVAGVLGVAAVMVLGLIDQARAYQVGGYSFDNRMETWRAALALFREQPLIGIGWESWNPGYGYPSSVNMLNAYLQVLAEMGLIGLAVMVAAMGRVAYSAYLAFRMTAGQRELRAMAYFAMAMLIAAAAHGVAESSALMGSSLMAVSLGLGAGLVDWLVATARSRQAWVIAHQAHLAAPLGTPHHAGL